MLQTLFSWPVVGPVAVLTIGIGIGVLSMTPPRFRIAEVCYSIAAILLLAKVATWIITEKHASITERFIVTFLIFGGVGLLWCEAMRWVESMTAQLVATAPPRRESHESSLGITGDAMVTNREPPQQSPLAVPGPTQSAGMSDAVSVVRTPASPHSGAIMASFTTSGAGEQEIDLKATPEKLVFEPPGTIVERERVPAELDIRGRKLTVVRFTDKGFVIDDHRTRGIPVAVYVVEGRPTIPKQPKNAEPPTLEKGKSDIHLEQYGGPNAATFGDNSPITFNAIPIPPPERTLSKEKFERLVGELSGLTGSTVSITIVPEDDETAAFGKQVRAAFQLAQWNVSGGISGTLSQTTAGGTGVTVFEGEGFNCDADANAPELAKALKAFEAVGLKYTVRSKGFLPNEGRAALAIVVGKRSP